MLSFVLWGQAGLRRIRPITSVYLDYWDMLMLAEVRTDCKKRVPIASFCPPNSKLLVLFFLLYVY